ncbi:hypothetical protein Trydic_g17590 [Trypoxylus dichotomus]
MPPILGACGIINNNSDKTEKFANYFEGTFRSNPPVDRYHEKFTNVINKQVHTEYRDTIDIQETTTEELRKIIKTLGDHKAPGHDGITNTAIKHLTLEAVDTLKEIINAIIRHQKKVEDELNRLEKEGIIEKVTGPTSWISPTVIIPKTQDLTAIRLCVDMRAANKAISRVRNVTPITDDISTQLNGANVFSKIDLKEGYHQLTLAEESRHITTFATHIGLFRYKRLSFGINTAAEIFQEVIRQTLSDIVNDVNISDDILMYGKTQAEYDQSLKQVFKRLQEKGLTVNKKKCLFNTESIKFFGHIFLKDGISPD